ncbi:MAG: peptide chain release factor 2 [Candidatus Omnitrophica bacterium]|nr:peptide chain release factor 2 [Candidatus Omnitrophota bacterium]
MIQDIQTRLTSLQEQLAHLRGYFDIEGKKKKADDYSGRMSSPDFWNNADESKQVVKELKALKSTIALWESAQARCDDLRELLEVSADDEGLLAELEQSLGVLERDIGSLEFETFLSGPFDRKNAILSINAGAGGTESCDWASMLTRMYTRWAQRHDCRLRTIDILPGEEAGIKNVTVVISGEYAYGHLRAERGVHRLVRISPFDSNKRRHTSFASVDVIPEVEEDVDIAIEEKDLRVDVYRSKGAGGQSVNTTDSAVRITHVPSGIVAQCQNERSQHQNKQVAMRILKARLFERQQQEKEAELEKQYGSEKKRIEWGSQIRSYVMHPYNMVKDHRSGCETGDVNRVMDGDIDDFIQAFLKMQKK